MIGVSLNLLFHFISDLHSKPGDNPGITNNDHYLFSIMVFNSLVRQRRELVCVRIETAISQVGRLCEQGRRSTISVMNR